MGRLVDNLLEMTRLEAGVPVLDKQWHVLEKIAGSALGRLKRELAGHKVRSSSTCWRTRRVTRRPEARSTSRRQGPHAPGVAQGSLGTASRPGHALSARLYGQPPP